MGYRLDRELSLQEIYTNVTGLHEVCVWLGSQIGKPIGEPYVASAQLVLEQGISLADVKREVKTAIEGELAAIGDFTSRLVQGEPMLGD